MFTVTENKFGIDDDMKKYVFHVFKEKFKTNMTVILDDCIQEIKNQPGFLEKFITKMRDFFIAKAINKGVKISASAAGHTAELATSVPGVSGVVGALGSLGGLGAGVGYLAFRNYQAKKAKTKLDIAKLEYKGLKVAMQYFSSENKKVGFQNFLDKLALTIMSEFVYVFAELGEYVRVGKHKEQLAAKDTIIDLADFFSAIIVQELHNDKFKEEFEARICPNEMDNYYDYLDYLIPQEEANELYSRYFNRVANHMSNGWTFAGQMLRSPLLDASTGELYLRNLHPGGRDYEHSNKYPPRLIFNFETPNKTRYLGGPFCARPIVGEETLSVLSIQKIISLIEYSLFKNKQQHLKELHQENNNLSSQASFSNVLESKIKSRESRKELSFKLKKRHADQQRKKIPKIVSLLQKYIKVLFELNYFRLLVGIILSPQEWMFLANELSWFENLIEMIEEQKSELNSNLQKLFKLAVEYKKNLKKLTDIQLFDLGAHFILELDNKTIKKSSDRVEDGSELVFPFWLRKKHEADIVRVKTTFFCDKVSGVKQEIMAFKKSHENVERSHLVKAQQLKQTLMLEKAKELFLLGRFSEAQDTLNEISKEFPDYQSNGAQKIAAWQLLALVQIQGGKYDEANNNIDKILKLSPRDEVALDLKQHIQEEQSQSRQNTI